ncbi:MFS transporter [Dongia deserti]|uniref:MFS transporter n=1 Tax=Dongia deserti TaxID=2268030 RepID=UPI000E65E96E|nr:MFS transporter [Dongia deserti]
MTAIAPTEDNIAPSPSPRLVVSALGIAQILAWGSSYYLPAVLAAPIAEDTGWPLSWVIGGLSLGLLVAGLISPLIGRRIHAQGGRTILAASAVLLASGMIVLAISPNLFVYLCGWVIMGLGMACGLYDAAFSTLGQLYGDQARRAIAALTLFGGFASTACWPLSAFLVSELGWRGACVTYALIHLSIVLPLYLVSLRGERAARGTAAPVKTESPRTAGLTLPFLLLAAVVTFSSLISTILSVHLLAILQAHDIALAAAVALGALVGPAQVGARFVEMMIARYHHPIWTMVASALLMLCGIGALWMNLPVLSLALVLYGAGLGIESIARATLPLALFDPKNYAPTMGKLAFPSLIAQAAAPSIGAFAMLHFGAGGTLATLTVLAAIKVGLVGALYACVRRGATRSTSASAK